MSTLDVYRAARSASLAHPKDLSDDNLARCAALSSVLVDEVNLRSELAQSEDLKVDSIFCDTERITLQLTGGYQHIMGLPEGATHPDIHRAFFAGVFRRLTCFSMHEEHAGSVSLPPFGLSERFCLTSPLHTSAEAPLVPPFNVCLVESVARALEAFCQSQETIYQTGYRQLMNPVSGITSGELALRNLNASVNMVLEAYQEDNSSIPVTLEALSFARGNEPDITRLDARKVFKDSRLQVQERALAGAGLLSCAYRQTATAQGRGRPPAGTSIAREDFEFIYQSAEKLMQESRELSESAWCQY